MESLFAAETLFAFKIKAANVLYIVRLALLATKPKVYKISSENIYHFIIAINKSFRIFAMQFENIKNSGYGIEYKEKDIECRRKKLNVG
jgi:hypothetical protein